MLSVCSKERKIQEKIDEATLEMKKVMDRMDAARKIEKEIEQLQKRIQEIDSELTKDR